MDPGWTEEERRVKGPFFRFWIPVLFFLFVWMLAMMFLDFIRWINS